MVPYNTLMTRVPESSTIQFVPFKQSYLSTLLWSQLFMSKKYISVLKFLPKRIFLEYFVPCGLWEMKVVSSSIYFSFQVSCGLNSFNEYQCTPYFKETLKFSYKKIEQKKIFSYSNFNKKKIVIFLPAMKFGTWPLG